MTTFLTIFACVSAIFVITANNPVISVLFLISVFLNVASYLILWDIQYLGLIYIIVYVGAIAILFLFVVMMLNIKLVELIEFGKQYTQNLPLGILVGSLFLFEFYTLVISSLLTNLNFYNIFNMFNSYLYNIPSSVSSFSTTLLNPSSNITYNSISHINAIGEGLYSFGSLGLILAAFIFLLAMIGPITLCLNKPAELKS